MRKGEMVARGAHASLAALLIGAHRGQDGVLVSLDDAIGPWLQGLFPKVCGCRLEAGAAQRSSPRARGRRDRGVDTGRGREGARGRADMDCGGSGVRRGGEAPRRHG